MTQQCLTKEEKDILASLKTDRTQEEIFNDIAIGIRRSSDGKLDEKESKHAARNLINFCQKLIDFQVRKDQQADV